MAQQILLRKFSHFHGIINYLAAAVQAWSLDWATNLDHIEIDVWSKTPIEAQLFVAEMAPLIQRRKIEETEINRFLDLVNVVAGQNDPGNMRFDQVQTINRMPEGEGVIECVYHFGGAVECLGASPCGLLISHALDGQNMGS